LEIFGGSSQRKVESDEIGEFPDGISYLYEAALCASPVEKIETEMGEIGEFPNGISESDEGIFCKTITPIPKIEIETGKIGETLDGAS